MRAKSLLTIVLSLLLISSTRAAAPLAEQAPADTLVYIGWAGADPLKPAYDQSHLAAVLDQSNFQQLLDEQLPKLWSMIAPRGQNDPHVITVKQIMAIFWHHPTSWYMAAMPAPVTPGSQPRFGLICDAGADAPALV